MSQLVDLSLLRPNPYQSKVRATQYDIELVMPMRTDHAWQKTTGGYDWCQFHIDWEAQQVTCPQGRTSGSWVLRRDKKGYPR
jgi:transposase